MRSSLVLASIVSLAAPALAASGPDAEAVAGDALPTPTVVLGAGFRGFTRSFDTTDGSTVVPAYQGAAAGVAADAQWFPAAFATRGPGGDFGLFAEGQFSIGLVTTFNAARFGTSATTLRGGLLVRVPSGRHGLVIHAGVESRDFVVAATAVDGSARPGLPNARYLGPRAGLGYMVALSRAFALEAKVGFVWTLYRGELASAAYFPSASAFALDAAARLSLTVASGVQLRLEGDFSRYFIALDAVHTAADQSFGGGLSVAVAL